MIVLSFLNTKVNAKKGNRPQHSYCTSPPFFTFFSLFSFSTKYRANANMMNPWPKSPNITENRNGKVITVNNAV